MRLQLVVVLGFLAAAVVAHWQGLRCDACGDKPPCKWDETCCDGKCVKMRSDPWNCGKCGRKCPEGKSCIDGCCNCGTHDKPTPNPPNPGPNPTNPTNPSTAQWLQCSCNQGSNFYLPVCGVCPLNQKERNARCSLICGKKGAVTSATCTNAGLSSGAVEACDDVNPGANQISCQPHNDARNSWYNICTSRSVSSLNVAKLCNNVIGAPAATILFNENSQLCGGNPNIAQGSELMCEGCGSATFAYFCAIKPNQNANANAACRQRCGQGAKAVHWGGACGRV